MAKFKVWLKSIIRLLRPAMVDCLPDLLKGSVLPSLAEEVCSRDRLKGFLSFSNNHIELDVFVVVLVIEFLVIRRGETGKAIDLTKVFCSAIFNCEGITQEFDCPTLKAAGSCYWNTFLVAKDGNKRFVISEKCEFMTKEILVKLCDGEDQR